MDEVIAGSSFDRMEKESGIFDTHVRAAAMTVDQLKGVALGLYAAVVEALKRVPWTPLDEAALQETTAEVDKGWLAECGEVNMKQKSSPSAKFQTDLITTTSR